MPEPRKPSLLLCATDPVRAAFNLASLGLSGPFLKGIPRSNGEPVLVLPGFLTNDVSTRVLRRTLKGLGYTVYGWDLGLNLGPRRHILFAMESLIEDIAFQHKGHKLALVGQSLGGVYARVLAHKYPDLIRQVVTLGSPYRVEGAEKTWLTPIFKTLMGNQLEEAMSHMTDMVESRLDMPTTSIYSKLDGVVPWQACIETPDAISENVEVYAAHCGMGIHSPTIRVVADRLGQDEKSWAPFNPGLLSRVVYPRPALVALTG